MKRFFPRLRLSIRQAALRAAATTLLSAAFVVSADGAPPANDNLANAQVIAPGASFSVTGNNAGATTEAFENASGYPATVGKNSVWFSWTPTVSGYLNTSAFRADNDPLNTVFFKGPGTPSSATYVTQDTVDNEGTIVSYHIDAGQQYFISLTDTAYPEAYTFKATVTAEPAFFSGEKALSNGVYYLAFPGGTPFGYYSYLTNPHYIYHFDLGYECVFDAKDGKNGVYLYDFASQTFFYTSPTFPFPYLYDFSLNAVLYYYPNTASAGHYTTNPRYFFNFATGQIITK